jgi:hypothetical protein
VLNPVIFLNFKKCWLRVNYLKSPSIRNSLYELNGLEDYCALRMDQHLARAHHELITIKPDEELEIIVPDKTDDIATEHNTDEEIENVIHIEDTLEEHPVDQYAAQGGHILPILRTILSQPYNRN